MITCDTHVLIYWALTPDRLSAKAAQTFEQARNAGELACADIVLWEIAMLIDKSRITIPQTPTVFLRDLLLATRMSILPIAPEIAVLAQDRIFIHGDPADRLIAATALHHQVALLSADRNLQSISSLRIIW